MRKKRSAWNKGRLLGQNPPLKPKEISVAHPPSACLQSP